MLVQADRLEVEEDDRRTVVDFRPLVYRGLAHAVSSNSRQHAAFRALNLPKDFNCSAVLRVP